MELTCTCTDQAMSIALSTARNVGGTVTGLKLKRDFTCPMDGKQRAVAQVTVRRRR